MFKYLILFLIIFLIFYYKKEDFIVYSQGFVDIYNQPYSPYWFNDGNYFYPFQLRNTCG